MHSPEAMRHAAARPAPASGERELKFVLPAGRIPLARRWLDSICRRDPAFPAAVVWTIYYDTPALVSLAEKINSDFLKRKIRVRWYSDLEGRPSGPVFVEAKMREGTRRAKARVRLAHPAEEVACWNLQDARLQTLPLQLRRQGIQLRELWQPVMLIRYRRDRLVEPASRSRVNLDSEIAAAAANPGVVSATDYSPIGSAVLEVKRAGDELPIALHPFLRLGARKESFSKFLAVYAHMTRQIL